MKNSVVVNNQLINYYSFGEGGGVPLVFLHGWRSNGLAWQKIASQLALGPFSVYLLDLPGFGESPLPKRDFYVQDYTDLITAFIEKLNLKKVILIGHSFGGRIATKLAAQNPSLIEKLVLVDSAGLIKPRSRGVLKTLTTIIAKLAKPLFSPKFMKAWRTKIYQKLGAEDYAVFGQLKQTFLNVIKEDLGSSFAQVTSPTLIIWGENDKTTPLTDAKIMNGLIKNSQLVVLKEAGHSCFIDQPQEFYKELVKFIK
ncbi:MAG: alpha/beta hydrolase [Candidatus Gribaldobacteria bacterium]|nr:alpha/beta hydrolase [Candidatus Gribaldobacteria bacterium]